jgi:tetratricopeptide (TPR) repeat protein
MDRKKYMKPGLLLLITVIFLSFSFNVYGQGSNEEGDECRLTREENMAMVAAQNNVGETKDYAAGRKPLLDHLATNPICLTETFYLLLGHYWYLDEKIEEALKVYEKGYAEYPESEQMVLNYSILLYEGERFAKAAPMFEKVYETLAKKDIKYLSNAAACYYMAEKLDDAKRVFKRLIEMSEKPEKTWYDSIIMIANEQERREEAEGYVMEALNIFPTEVKYWQFLASLRQEKEDIYGMAGAQEIITHIKTPESMKEWDSLIKLYRWLNVPLRVAEKMEQAIKTERPKEEDHILIADAYAQAMRIDEAVAYLDKIIAKNSSTRLMEEKTKILFESRRNEEAIKAADELIAADPKIGMVYIWKGKAALDLKDWETAMEAFKGALIDKDYREAAKNAIDVLNNLEEAKKD